MSSSPDSKTPMTVADILNQHKGASATVLLNTGNKGDGLIHAGARTLLDRYHIGSKEIYYPQRAGGKILIVHGAGGFCLPFHHNVKRAEFYYDAFEKIYIFPSSFDLASREVRDFIRRLPKKVTVFCRERYSFEQVIKAIVHRDNVHLDRDTAFYVDYTPFRRERSGVLLAFRRDYRSNKNLTRCLARLFLHRTVEARFSFKGGEKVDRFDPSIGRENQWEELLADISPYAEIHTDRAHVAIASAMLGIKTHVYPGFYHKVRGIYEYSLAGRSNVRWML